MRLTSGFLRSIVGGSWSLESGAQSLSFTKGGEERVTIAYFDLISVTITRGFSTGLKISSKSRSVEFNGLSESDANRFITEVKRLASRIVAEKINAISSDLLAIREKFLNAFEGDFYLNQSKISEIKQLLPSTLRLFDHPFFDARLIDPKLSDFAQEYSQFVNPASNLAVARNDKYVARKKNEYRSLFSSLEKYPLTDEQQTAVVTEEDNVLLNAAAGSGKSSVITAKIVYMLKEKQFEADQIAVFAFNRDTQKELAEKITRLCMKAGVNGDEITVKTFHSFSLEVISEVTKKKPSISKLSESKSSLYKFFDEKIKYLCATDSQFLDAFVTFNSVFKTASPDESAIQTKIDYDNYLIDLDGSRSRDPNTGEWRVTLRTMDGNEVKSLEELRISNWLFINGIDYEYERNYEVETTTAEKRQYRPDFYYPQIDVYHEHFALNASGSPPNYMTGYLDGVKWKRELHSSNETDLIETHSAHFHDGTVFDLLKSEFMKRGIKPQRRPSEIIDKIITETFNPDRDIDFLVTFLNHYKATTMTPEILKERANQHGDRSRANALIKVVLPLFNEYERALTREASLDYQDLLNHAATYIESGRFVSPYRYVLVDEFQDSSQSFLRLIRALKAQEEETKFFAVGDDWQSIYGFAGADIEVIRKFSGLFGYTKELFLTKTFRSFQEIVDVASRFVQANPNQVSKTVRSIREAGKKAVFLKTYIGIKPDQELLSLLESLNSIGLKQQARLSVFFLVRYSHLSPRLNGLPEKFRYLDVQIKTIHTSKGLEADYVFVIGVDGGKYGFP
ncbi:UvrD-helicase domain-containing protein, partial [Litoricolaceae bacterium]|nr:UvrD-helicase domain-containing protein [Litorivicinaceae bacterium]